MATNTGINWHRKSSGLHEIEHIVSIDADDKNKKDYLFFDPVISNNSGVVEATNKAAAISTGDILIYLSDDFDCPQNWDEKIVQRTKGIINPWLLKVDDCLQKFGVCVLTIPIMSRELYERLGTFWNPNYKSMFCDEDLYWVCKNNNWIIEAQELKFPHLHPSNKKGVMDETYKRSNLNWDQGKEVFRKRKQNNFPI